MMQKVSRNDLCPCGSGKKYKKCCLDKDAASLAAMTSAAVDVLRPAALRLAGESCVPAIVGEHEESGQCLFVLARASRQLYPIEAAEEAEADLDSVPGSSPGYVGPDCLRYLRGIGYTIIPGLTVPDERVTLLKDIPDDDDLLDDDAAFDEAIEMLSETAEQQIRDEDPPEVRQTLVRLRRAGYSRSDIMDMIVHLLMHATAEAVQENREPDMLRYAAALLRLPEMTCIHDPIDEPSD